MPELLALFARTFVIGIAVLVYLGVRPMLSRPAECIPAAREAQSPGSQHAATYLSAVGLTLTNPMTIMAFCGVFASAGLVARVAAGSRLITAVSRVSGTVIAGFGLLAIGSAVWALLG